MAESDHHPMSLRPGQYSPPPSSGTQSSSQPPQESNTGRALDRLTRSDQENQPDSLTKTSSYGELRPHSGMNQQSGGQANYGSRFPSSHMGQMSNQGEPPSMNQQENRAFGPGDAPRSRSSTFGQQYNAYSTQVPPMPQQPLFAQHSGPGNTSIHAGPSGTRPISQGHPSGPPQSSSGIATRPGTSSKSPFTSPITCPPRNRPNQILLVNPTSTTALTGSMINTLRPILPHALEITAYNAPYPAPTAIESTVDSVLSSETVLRDLAKYSTNNGETVQNFDALLIATYGKHPLVDALRESYDVPVIGILEASLYVARMLGGRFGIISTSTRMKLQIDDAVSAHGLSHFLIGVESLHINPLELLSASASLSTEPANGNPDQPSTPTSTSCSREDLHKRLTVQSRTLVARGADTIILGSEFFSTNEVIRVVKDAIREEDGRRTVNVVDPVEAGVMMLNGLVGMGVPTSKKGVFRGEREGRRGRGQTWL